ncbi:MAG: hypothetical protein JKY37_26745 [Nannocystaceae bacterium]|nr:hypothetical protein [Nannocystaceae bacterium]
MDADVCSLNLIPAVKPIEIPETALTLDAGFPKTDGLTTGEVVDDRHPALVGRIRVHRVGDAAPHWLSTLRGISARIGDRLVTEFVEGHDDPIVIGVVDGYQERAPGPDRTASLELQRDETITIYTRDGTLLLAIRSGEHGPILRLGGRDVCCRRRATSGSKARASRSRQIGNNVSIRSAADVDIQGETIQLN